jgi:hypothetical protein
MGQGSSRLADLYAAKGWPAFMNMQDMSAQTRAFSVTWSSGAPLRQGSRVRLMHAASRACIEYEYLANQYFQRVDAPCGGSTRARSPAFPAALAAREVGATGHMPFTQHRFKGRLQLTSLRGECAEYVAAGQGVWRKTTGSCPSRKAMQAAEEASEETKWKAKWAAEKARTGGMAIVPVWVDVKNAPGRPAWKSPAFNAAMIAMIVACVRAGVDLLGTPLDRIAARADRYGMKWSPATMTAFLPDEISVGAGDYADDFQLHVDRKTGEATLRAGGDGDDKVLWFTLTKPPQQETYIPWQPNHLQAAVNAWKQATGRGGAAVATRAAAAVATKAAVQARGAGRTGRAAAKVRRAGRVGRVRQVQRVGRVGKARRRVGRR